MPRGGRRNGAGRPKGGKDWVDDAAVLKYASEGLMPLPFLLGEMRRLVEAGHPSAAFRYAKEAAPYCHRRLASVEFSDADPSTMTDDNLLKIASTSDAG